MNKLRNELDQLIDSIDNSGQIREYINNQDYISPFSKEGCQIAYLMSKGVIDFEKYMQISRDYAIRNKYLYLYDMAPRTFGETWGENHILALYPDTFIKATRKSMIDLYPNYAGEFDLFLDGLRIEVKACRANKDKFNKNAASLSSRAYSREEAIKYNFEYHYQQLKPSCCDAFIWIGVCKDEILYWVLTNEEVKNCPKFCPQHRNENTGIKGSTIFEGQVFMNENDLKPYLVNQNEIPSIIKTKCINLSFSKS